MSKLKDLVGRGVRLIVTEVPEGRPPEREIPPEAFADTEGKPVTRSEVPADVADFGLVYDEAGVALPRHGYGIEKVREMLASKRLESLGREVRASAVLAALEAAGVPVREVIQDAVARDRALDAFEAAKERELAELRAKADARIKAIKDELDALLREKNTEMEDLRKSLEAAERAFLALKTRKLREEERLHDVVAHFIEGAPNPVTTKPPPPAKAG